LHCEEESAQIHVENLVVVLLGDVADRCKFAKSRVCKHNVDSSLLPLDLRIEPVQVAKVRDITLDCGHISSDPGGCLIQFFLTSAGNKDMRSLRYEFFGRSQSNTAFAASDHGYLILQFPHPGDFSFFLFVLRDNTAM
jgi:hypothetical protein